MQVWAWINCVISLGDGKVWIFCCSGASVYVLSFHQNLLFVTNTTSIHAILGWAKHISTLFHLKGKAFSGCLFVCETSHVYAKIVCFNVDLPCDITFAKQTCQQCKKMQFCGFRSFCASCKDVWNVLGDDLYILICFYTLWNPIVVDFLGLESKTQNWNPKIDRSNFLMRFLNST